MHSERSEESRPACILSAAKNLDPSQGSGTPVHSERSEESRPFARLREHQCILSAAKNLDLKTDPSQGSGNTSAF
jgi:hypothetical protein